MSKFIVMDIVFNAGSLNYDQGSGNYQELKKITKWDGKQYTFVSRYALRYSILETGRRMGLWEVADGKDIMPEKNQKVIQPSENLLLSGRILEYPEFDLFGYLLTSTQPQNFREAPVKLSHAVSLTPYNYDALFNANIGLANRLRKHYGEMSPNPFTVEEHFTYYQYSIVMDINRVGNIEIYLSKKYKKGGKEKGLSKFIVKESEERLEFLIEYGDLKKISFTVPMDNKIILEKVYVPLDGDNISVPEEFQSKFYADENLSVAIFKFNLINIKERVEQLTKVILNLHRSIKGRDEDLSPKLLILGLYENEPYRTFKDKIMLKDEYTEEEYDEIIEKEEDGKITRRVVHRVSKSKKPIFEIYGQNGDPTELDKEQIIKIVGKFLEPEKPKEKEQEQPEGEENEQHGGKEGEQPKIYIYKSPEIEIVTSKKESAENPIGA